MPAGQVRLSEQPDGFVLREGFVGADEERTLLAALERLGFRPVTVRGQSARRSVRPHGLDYGY